MTSEILFIADDFGITEETNRAIVHAHRHGALHGASLMLGQSATDHAVELAREHPDLQIGWHLHLADSRPCTIEAWPWGRSPARGGIAIAFSPRMRVLARREIERQWDAFRETGLACRFVNAHHHLHVHPFVRRALVETLAGSFAGWVRWGRLRFFGSGPLHLGPRAVSRLLQAPQLPFRTSTTLWGLDRTFRMNAEEVRRAVGGLENGLHEFLFHPRRIDGDPDTASLLALRGDTAVAAATVARSASA